METTLRVERVDASRAAHFGQVAQQGFGMPDWYGTWCEALVTLPDVYNYLLRAGFELAYLRPNYVFQPETASSGG